MTRDRRLAAAIALLALSAIAASYQAWVIALFIEGAVLGHWEVLAKTFSVELPPAGPNQFCFDWCAPEMPFLAGWLALGSFVIGLALVALAWWRPRA